MINGSSWRHLVISVFIYGSTTAPSAARATSLEPAVGCVDVSYWKVLQIARERTFYDAPLFESAVHVAEELVDEALQECRGYEQLRNLTSAEMLWSTNCVERCASLSTPITPCLAAGASVSDFGQCEGDPLSAQGVTTYDYNSDGSVLRGVRFVSDDGLFTADSRFRRRDGVMTSITARFVLSIDQRYTCDCQSE